MNLNKIKKIADQAARQAGREVKKYYLKPNKIKYSLKSKHQVVTIADKLADKLIISKVKNNFPDHGILSEESGRLDYSSRDFLWIIDPLDGTTNFTIKNPFFAVSIAVVYKKRPIYGVIYAPILNEFYYALESKGAYFNNKKIKVSQTKDIYNGFHTYCYGSGRSVFGRTASNYYKKMFLSGLEIRQLGAASLEFSRVARGITESIVIPGANSWDVAAGALLVKEAGGRVTDFHNRPWNLKSQDIIATNGNIHKQILKYL